MVPTYKLNEALYKKSEYLVKLLETVQTTGATYSLIDRKLNRNSMEKKKEKKIEK